MSRIKLVNFYPSNQTTSATEANANNSAINGSTQKLDDENVRNQGIDMVNLGDNPHLRFTARQDNGAYASLGTAPSTHNGWIYNAFTIPGTPAGQHYSQTGSVNAVFEYPINHDNSFTFNTAANKGTKIQVNGTDGIALAHHQKIQVNWNVNLWDIYHNGTKSRLVPQHYMSQLVDTARSGIGVGEYYYLIYPKFNTISSALVDTDFKTADDAGFYQAGVGGSQAYYDPDDLTNGNSDVQFSYNNRRFDHCSVVPMHLITATQTASGGGRFAAYATYDFSSQEFATAGPAMQILGQHTFNVNVANGGGKTLYGVQMFISGPYRVNSTGQFLESQITDPTNAKYGVDVSVVLERAAVEIEIINPQSARS
tara:strand:- start:2637 stop:3740 length:1104 start_codon:yes stop_codon:yes gene_type:complete